MKFNKIIYLFAIISIFGLNVFAQKLTTARWIPTFIEGSKIKETKAFIEFGEGEKRLTGNAGCNRLFGSFEIDGKRLKFSDIGTTKMFCADESVMKNETAFLEVLSKTTAFKKSGNTLKLYNGKRQIAKFKSANVENSSENKPNSFNLEDKKWILESVKNDALPKVETDAFIVFNREKQSAGGNTSCNVFGAEYETDGKNLKITQGIQTFRACVEDERMNIEKEFMKGLQNTNRYEIRGEKLYLYQGDELLLTFRAAAKDK